MDRRVLLTLILGLLTVLLTINVLILNEDLNKEKDVDVSITVSEWNTGIFDRVSAKIDDQGISIKEGYEIMHYWRSPTYNLSKVEKVHINAQIPDDSYVGFNVVKYPKSKSKSPEDLDMIRIKQNSSVVSFDSKSDSVYQVVFQMKKKSSRKSPKIVDFTLKGEKDPQAFLRTNLTN